MKSVSIASVALVAMFCATSCQKAPQPVIEMGTVPIGVTGQISSNNSVQNNSSSRVNEASGVGQFDQDDQISFYAVKYNGQTANMLGADANTYIDNELYKRTGDLFRSWDGTSAFRDRYFPNDGSAVDIYGIFPYQATKPANFEAFDFAVNTDQSKIADYYASDMLMAKTVKIAPTAVPCKLVFNHLMARMVINIKLSGFDDNVVVSNIRVLNALSKATVNLRAYNQTTGIAGAIVGTSIPADLTPLQSETPVQDFNNTYIAVAPAQLFTSGSEIIEVTTNTANKDKYRLALASALTMQSGMEHIFNITIEFGGRPNLVINPASIAPWGTTTTNLAGQKKSECKFIVTLLNPGATTPANTGAVKIGVNGNRTFTLPATYSAAGGAGGAPAITFEFRGDGNRPHEYPFDITSLELLQNDLTSSVVGKIAVSGLQIVATDRNEEAPVALNYNIANKSLTR